MPFDGVLPQGNPLMLKLIEAMRSGKYDQCRGVVMNHPRDGGPTQFCALGLAIHIATGIERWSDYKYRALNYSCYALPPEIAKAYGFSGRGKDGEQVSLAGPTGLKRALYRVNDSGASFKKIADLLEKQYVKEKVDAI